MQATIVKIDLCGSKEFSAAHERQDPSIRKRTLERLLSIAKNCFPASEDPYPKGTLYKADGDALWFVLEKTPVALRGAIEFMQLWFREAQAGFPECRVFLDRGTIDEVAVAGRTELTGAVFENISVFEKGLPEAKIFVTRAVVDDADPTMAKFSFVSDVTPRQQNTFSLYLVNFSDPRTVADSSWAHAVFVAHPKAVKARERVFELLLLQYFDQQTGPSAVNGFIEWAESHNFSVPDQTALSKILDSSEYFQPVDGSAFQLSAGAKTLLREAHEEFATAQRECEQAVRAAIELQTHQNTAVTDIALGEVIEEYLCATFAEIRMMANYFRATERLFESGLELFARYDYILRRRLDPARLRYFEDWRRGFILGLQQAAEANNIYIAAVFHNVLAMYYVNRTPRTAAWQIERLRDRRIFLDTNVLYSRLVPAGQYHQIVAYFMNRLSKLGVGMFVLPITLEEYEDALMFVERNVDADGNGSPVIIERNPWLYQEFMLNKGKYLSSISACRAIHSVTKGICVENSHYDELDTNLRAIGVRLHRDQQVLSDDEVDKLWLEHRNMMASNYWDMTRYWEFISHAYPQSVKRHDMTSIVTLNALAQDTPHDELGPGVLFVTVDSKLRRLRPRYPFIITPEQFLEYTLPYLFLADIPVKDAEQFPNALLAAQLGTLLVRRPPELVEIVRASLDNPAALKHDVSKTFPTLSDDMARALNQTRFKNVIAAAADATPAQKRELSVEAAAALGSYVNETRAATSRLDEIDELREELAERDRQIEKLEKKLYYWRHRPTR